MKKAIIFVATITATLVLLASAFTQSPAGSKYIGYKYAVPELGGKLPNGFTYHGGGLIGDIDAKQVYGVSILSKGKAKMFWLEISTARDDRGGVTEWEVKDVLEFSGLRSSDFVMEFAEPAFECRKGKTVISGDLIGIGIFNRKRGIFTPRKLWRPDAETAKFEALSAKNVSCIYSEP